jgi:hypothetical protein
MAVLTRLGTPFCSFVDEWTDMMVGQPDSSVELWDIKDSKSGQRLLYYYVIGFSSRGAAYEQHGR